MPHIFIFVILVAFSISDTVAESSTINKHPIEFPIYHQKSGTLHIPRIDTPEKISNYQNASLMYDQQIDAWRLTGLTPLSDESQGNVSIHGVNVVVTNTFPIQVFLHVTGDRPNCGIITPSDQRRRNNIFDVRMRTNKSGLSALCVPNNSFSEFVPLAVYGLDAGDYEYHVNDKFNGTFRLLEDNRFAE